MPVIKYVVENIGSQDLNTYIGLEVESCLGLVLLNK